VVPRAASTLRAPWFEVSCCPTNLARTFAGLAAYLATSDDEGVQIHQYTAAQVRTSLPGGRTVGLDIGTDYPADGRITIRITESPETPWTLTLRVPQWAAGATLDGVSVSPGQAQVRRRFTPGETVVLDLAIRPRFTAADARVDSVRGCAAVERGPVVYCVESVDLPAHVPLEAVRLDPSWAPEDRDGTVVAAGRIAALPDERWPYASPPELEAAGEPLAITLRPYHDWAGRGPSTMRVWLPVTGA
jgi:DUF1680 family protein